MLRQCSLSSDQFPGSAEHRTTERKWNEHLTKITRSITTGPTTKRRQEMTMSRFSIPVHRQTHRTLIREYKSGHRLHLSVVTQHMRRQGLKRPKARFTLCFKHRHCGTASSESSVGCRPCKSSNNTNSVMAQRPALNRMAVFGPVALIITITTGWSRGCLARPPGHLLIPFRIHRDATARTSLGPWLHTSKLQNAYSRRGCCSTVEKLGSSGCKESSCIFLSKPILRSAMFTWRHRQRGSRNTHASTVGQEGEEATGLRFVWRQIVRIELELVLGFCSLSVFT